MGTPVADTTLILLFLSMCVTFDLNPHGLSTSLQPVEVWPASLATEAVILIALSATMLLPG